MMSAAGSRQDGCHAQPLAAIQEYAPMLKAGAAVVATDYPGLGAPGSHPYLVGESEARSVLDAVRAARQLTALRLSSDLVVFGDTQGAGRPRGPHR
jgi:hypothetical protein